MASADPHEIKRAIAFDWLQKDGIEGVGIGCPCLDGQHVLRPNVDHHLHVYLSMDVVTPYSIDGVRIERHYTKPIKAFDSYSRPVTGGASVGAFSNLVNANVTGTYGLTGFDLSGNSFVVSAAHVLASADSIEQPTATMGTPVWNPGSYFGGSPTTDAFAALYSWSRISRREVNLCEWALAQPTDPSVISTMIQNVGTPTSIADAAMGIGVIKTGALTGTTQSVVTDVDAAISVNYDGVYDATYDHQVIVANPNFSFANEGDSGACVNTFGPSGEVITLGMVIAGSDTMVITSPMTAIAAASGLIFQTVQLAPLQYGGSDLTIPALAAVGAFAVGGYYFWRRRKSR